MIVLYSETAPRVEWCSWVATTLVREAGLKPLVEAVETPTKPQTRREDRHRIPVDPPCGVRVLRQSMRMSPHTTSATSDPISRLLRLSSHRPLVKPVNCAAVPRGVPREQLPRGLPRGN